MVKVTQIVLVGHTKVRLVEGIRRVPADKTILVVGNNLKLEGEAKVVEIAEAIEALFKGLMVIERVEVDKENIFAAASVILQKIREEVKAGAEVRINISGSLRQMAIACYVAALVSKTPLHSVLPEYDQDFQEVGVKEVYEIPYFPIKQLSTPEVKILRELQQRGVVESVEQMMVQVYGDVEEREYNKIRAKISYYLKGLEEDGFIQKKRAGQKVSLELTPLGRIYILGQEILDLKKGKNE